MSNDIYNILGKLKGLEPKQETQQPAQTIYESVEARGSIVAGVKDIEQKLREQFEATKEERETLKTKGGTIYKGGTYGTSFDVGDDGKKKVKHVPKTGQKGRPKKDAGEAGKKYDTPKGDIFGRTTGSVPKGKKGTVVKGKANVDTVDESYDDNLDEVVRIQKWDQEGNESDPQNQGERDQLAKLAKSARTARMNPRDKEGNPLTRDWNSAPGAKMNPPWDAASTDSAAHVKPSDAARNGYKYGTKVTNKSANGFMGTGLGNKARSGNAGKGVAEEELGEMTNPFAIGMAQAKKEVGLGKAKATGLPKKVVAKGHEIGKAVKRSMNESISLRENPETMQHIVSKYRNEVKRFIRDDDLDHDLYEALFDYYFDAGEMPYGTAKGRTGDPYEWIADRFAQDVHDYVVDETSAPGASAARQMPTGQDILPTQKPGFLDKAKAFGQKAVNTLGHGSDEDMINDLRRKTMGEDSELNELAKLAGLQVEESVTECMSPLAGGAVEMQQAEQQKGRMSVNTSADSEGHKTVTITADGEEAEKLAQLLQLAGMGNHQAQPQHAEQAAIVVAQEAKDYGNTDVEEPEEVLNTPRPDVQGMHRSPTTGLNKDTDDLNKPKSQNPATAAKGDNPLTKKEKTIEDFNPIDQLGAKLMAEYQSIKVQK